MASSWDINLQLCIQVCCHTSMRNISVHQLPTTGRAEYATQRKVTSPCHTHTGALRPHSCPLTEPSQSFGLSSGIIQKEAGSERNPLQMYTELIQQHPALEQLPAQKSMLFLRRRTVTALNIKWIIGKAIYSTRRFNLKS